MPAAATIAPETLIDRLRGITGPRGLITGVSETTTDDARPL